MATHRPHVLMMATNGFEEAELFGTRERLIDAGVDVTLASISKDPISGVAWDGKAHKSVPSTRTITPELTVDQVDSGKFDALVLPGGTDNPDTLRINKDAVDVVRRFTDEGKLVAAICHAPWLLVEADVLRGRRATGWSSIRTDMKNAGAEVVDKEVVVDGKLITSRMPDDVPAFAQAIATALEKVSS